MNQERRELVASARKKLIQMSFTMMEYTKLGSSAMEAVDFTGVWHARFLHVVPAGDSQRKLFCGMQLNS